MHFRKKSSEVALEFISNTLMNNADFYLLPIFSSMVVDGYAKELLDTLDKGDTAFFFRDSDNYCVGETHAKR